jgi:hypothetical protein
MSSERYLNCVELPYRSLCVEHERMPSYSPYQSVETVNLSNSSKKIKTVVSSITRSCMAAGRPITRRVSEKARSNE